MALIQGSDITTEAIIEGFQKAVVDNILSGAYHAGNPPMCRGYQCVPTSMMDHVDNVNQVPDVGREGEIVSAAQVLAGLISITRNLTRVGSFVFTLYIKETNGGTTSSGSSITETTSYREIANMSGKVVFTNGYVRTGFGAPSDLAGTEVGQIIKASNLNQLFANIYQQWSSTSREQYSGSAITCHNSCHYNCHYNCHGNCHDSCHGWTIIKNDL